MEDDMVCEYVDITRYLQVWDELAKKLLTLTGKKLFQLSKLYPGIIEL